jgi:hypothetical protein
LHSSSGDGANKRYDNEMKSSAVIVPGDILSDLMRAQLIGDHYYDRNFLTERRIWMGDLVSDNAIATSTDADDDTTTSTHTQKQLEQRTRTWILSP